MRARFDIETYTEYLHSVYEAKELMYKFVPFFTATKGNVFLRSIRSMVKQLRWMKTQDGFWGWPTKDAQGNYVATYGSPKVVRIHKSFGQGWLHFAFGFVSGNVITPAMYPDSDVDENTIRLTLLETQDGDPSKGIEINLTPRQRKALYLLVSGRFKDLGLRPIDTV
jgi:hypothetical protein